MDNLTSFASFIFYRHTDFTTEFKHYKNQVCLHVINGQLKGSWSPGRTQEVVGGASPPRLLATGVGGGWCLRWPARFAPLFGQPSPGAPSGPHTPQTPPPSLHTHSLVTHSCDALYSSSNNIQQRMLQAEEQQLFICIDTAHAAFASSNIDNCLTSHDL